MKKTMLKYGITTVIGLAAAYAVAAYYGYSVSAEAAVRYHILADAFTVPGILFLGLGALVWLSGEGSFDGVAWLLSNAFKTLIPGMWSQREKFGDYIERKRSREKPRGYGFIAITGAVFIMVAVLFLLKYSGANAM